MNATRKVTCAIAIALAMGGCAQTPMEAAIAKSKVESAEILRRDQLTHVNANWRVDCVTDPVKATKDCFAGTFGQAMTHDGVGYGGKDMPFQVRYLNGQGPVIVVGWNSYPGKTPTIRVDESPPIRVSGSAEPDVIKQLLTGSTVRGEYYAWPSASPKRIIVDLAGFGEAWTALQAKLGEQK
jgi:hypothetical protein